MCFMALVKSYALQQGPNRMSEFQLFGTPPASHTGLLSAMFAAAMLFSSVAQAQTSESVTVNLGVLDDVDPMATVPRLLMPNTGPGQGRIILRPPPGVDPITPQRSRVVLRPPPGAPARVTSAPSIAVPAPAAAAPSPPTSVTSVPSPPPVPPAAPPAAAPTASPPAPEPAAPEPAAPEPAPSVAVNQAPLEEPAAEPEPAEPSGPAIASMANDNGSGATESETQESAPEQTAALPPANEPAQDAAPVSIVFGVDVTDLPDSAPSTLSELADTLKADNSLRVRLMAYASNADGSPSSVRRTSLSRALSIREFLMDQGIQATRFEIRALGDQNDGGEPDRVDAIVEQR